MSSSPYEKKTDVTVMAVVVVLADILALQQCPWCVVAVAVVYKYLISVFCFFSFSFFIFFISFSFPLLFLRRCLLYTNFSLNLTPFPSTPFFPFPLPDPPPARTAAPVIVSLISTSSASANVVTPASTASVKSPSTSPTLN